jgi:hypothetical protein
MKHLSFKFLGLTSTHKLGERQGLAGSLTGAVSSKNVTEEYKGTLISNGNGDMKRKSRKCA